VTDELQERPEHARTHMGRVQRDDDGPSSPELRRAHFLGVNVGADDLWRVDAAASRVLHDSRAAATTKAQRAAAAKGAATGGAARPVVVSERIIPVLPNEVDDEDDIASLYVLCSAVCACCR
jgi:hypothetical protein